VLSDITGGSGQAIIRAIVTGKRDPHVLAALRHKRIRKSEAEIVAALTVQRAPANTSKHKFDSFYIKLVNVPEKNNATKVTHRLSPGRDALLAPSRTSEDATGSRQDYVSLLTARAIG